MDVNTAELRHRTQLLGGSFTLVNTNKMAAVGEGSSAVSFTTVGGLGKGDRNKLQALRIRLSIFTPP